MGRDEPDFTIELSAMRKGAQRICGIDEAGRGPWAGPVVAAAVILDRNAIPPGLNDSKKLSHAQREALFYPIVRTARIGIGIADVDRIDRDNVLGATMWAMGQALAQLGDVSLALIDGNRAPKLSCSVQTVIGGDAKSLSISAASIIAKVTRDRIMMAHDATYPQYGFARHKGYGTQVHQQALTAHGPCPLHRKSFAPVAAFFMR